MREIPWLVFFFGREAMTKHASGAAVFVGPVTAEQAASRAETAPASRRRARAGRVSGAPIDLEAWSTRAFFGLADVLGRYHRLIGLISGGDAARYRGMPLSFGLLGLHLVPGLLPFPVRLTHVIAKPLDLGDRARAQRDPEALAEPHARVWHGCQRFLDRVVAQRARYSDALDRSIRDTERLLQRVWPVRWATVVAPSC
jgi:hypothetical protein